MQDDDANEADEHGPEHPGKRAWEPADPMQLSGHGIPGDPAIMFSCLVEEYARMGWGAARIAQLFDSPFYQGTFDLGRTMSKADLLAAIEKIVSQTGVLRFRTTYAGEGGDR